MPDNDVSTKRQGKSMRSSLVFLLATLTACGALSQEIATCRAPVGKAYYHFAGLVSKPESGWAEDKITGGVFTLTKVGDKLDLLFVDLRNKPISSQQDGGEVILLRSGTNSITVLVHYPEGPTTEIYSFFKEKGGANRFTLMQSKTGDLAMAPKGSLMVGTCDPIRFDVLN